MKVMPKILAAAVLAALSSPAFADIEFDVIGGSEITFTGLIQTDGYWYSDDVQALGGTPTSTSSGDGTDTDFGMRRSELVFKGKGPGQWNWVAGYDFTGSRFLDVNVAYKFSAFTAITVGQYKQPNSLEELSSTKNNDFISKAMTTNLQGVARRVGVAAVTGDTNWSITGSVFGDTLTRNINNGNGYGVRGTFAPFNEAGSILHLGLSWIDYAAELSGSAPGARPVVSGDNQAQWRVRPDADLTGVRLVDSGVLKDADRNSTWGAEAAWVHGPFKLQGEYMDSRTTRSTNPTYNLDSWYVYGVWNITGETWTYKDTVLVTGLPDNPGLGMWQIGLRYDAANLNDGSVGGTVSAPVVSGVLGGEEDNWTLGVNWYWRSNFKFSMNYVWATSEKWSSSKKAFVQDDPSILEVRAQIYW